MNQRSRQICYPWPQNSTSPLLVCVFVIVLVVVLTPAQGSSPNHQPKPPIYVVEILFFHDNHLFLGRETLPTPRGETRLMRAAAFLADGKYIRPPDPGYKTIVAVPKKGRLIGQPPLKKPPAATTHYYGCSMRRSGGASIRVSDLRRYMPLPEKNNEPKYQLWCNVLFRIERVENDSGPLRQDYAFWKNRTAEILKEAKAIPNNTMQKWLKQLAARKVNPTHKQSPLQKKADEEAIRARLDVLSKGAGELQRQLFEATGRKKLIDYDKNSPHDQLCRKAFGHTSRISLLVLQIRRQLPSRSKYQSVRTSVLKLGQRIEDSLGELDKLLANKKFVAGLPAADARVIREMRGTVRKLIAVQREQTKQLRH